VIDPLCREGTVIAPWLAPRHDSSILKVIGQFLSFEDSLSTPFPFNLTFSNNWPLEISPFFHFGGIDVVSGAEFTFCFLW
jgi:hypothetical protein